MTPDSTEDFNLMYGKIIGELGREKIYSVDLILSAESVFNNRKDKFILERTIYQKGRRIYEHA